MRRFSKIWDIKLFLGLCVLSFQLKTQAIALSEKGITFQAVVRNSSDVVVNNTTASVSVQILGAVGAGDDCVLFEENHSSVDLSASSGYLSLTLGKGTRTANDEGLSFREIFDNSRSFSSLSCVDGAGNATVTTSYTPSATSVRKLRVVLGLASPAETVRADFNLRSAAFAANAESLNGKTETDFLNVTSDVTQTKANSLFAAATWSKLTGLLSNFDGTNYTGNVLGNAATATTAGNVTGTVAVANGGTGATSASSARTNLGLGSLATLSPTGTADNTTYLRGDGTWATVSGGGAVSSVAGRTGAVTLTSSDLSDFATASDSRADGRITAQKGLANGLASLDGSGKVPSTQIALSASDVPSLDTSKITTGTFANSMIAGLGIEKLINAATKFFNYKPNNVACADNEVLKYDSTLDSGNGGWKCAANSATNFTGSISGDVSGTQGATSVDKIKGKTVSPVAYSVGQVLRYDGINWVNNNLSMFDIRSTVTGTQAFGGVGCLSNQTLTWTAATDNLSCSNISITKSQVSDFPTLGSMATEAATDYLSKAGNLSGLASTSTARSNLGAAASGANGDITSMTAVTSVASSGALSLSAGGTNQNVTVSPSGSGNTILNGKVGVGVSSPSYKFHVTEGSSPTSGSRSVFGMTADGDFSDQGGGTDESSSIEIGFGVAINPASNGTGGSMMFKHSVTDSQSMGLVPTYVFKGSLASNDLSFVNGGIYGNGYSIFPGGKIGLGVASPSSVLHLKAGSIAANTAPLKFTSGPLLTTPEDGAMEYDGTSFYLTSGSTRRSLASISSGTIQQNVSQISNSSGSITLSPSAGNSVIVSGGAASTSTTTGALVVSGGVGVSGEVNIGGNLTANGNLVTAASPAATGGSNVNSPLMYLSANYWNGSVSAVDSWSIQNILGTGTNPTSTLTFSHSGSSGSSRYAFLNGRVGVGTNSPVSALHVDAGGSTYSEMYFTSTNTGATSADGLAVGLSNSSQDAYVWNNENSKLRFATNNTERMVITADGKVGIGASNPAARLRVTHTSTDNTASGWNVASSSYHTVNPSGAAASTYYPATYSTAESASANSQNIGAIYGALGEALHSGTGALSWGIGVRGIAHAYSSGSVTNLVGVLAEAYSDATGNPTNAVTNAYGLKAEANFPNPNSVVTAAYGVHASMSAGSSITTGYGLYVGNVEGTTQYGLYQSDSGANNYFNGKIGLGTTSPSTELEIRGVHRSSNTGNIQAFVSESAIDTGGSFVLGGNDGVSTGRAYGKIVARKENSTSGDYSSYLAFYSRANGSNVSEQMRISSDGSVGIGTTTTSNAVLSVVGNNNATYSTHNILSRDQTAWAQGVGGGIGFAGYIDGSSWNTFGAIHGGKENATISDSSGYLSFTTRIHGSGVSERARITSTGNLGVGTSSPGEKLDVSGNAKIQGQLYSKSRTIAGGTSSVDWNDGNSISTDYGCASNLSFSNLRDGGTYTLVVTDAGTNQCSFSTTTTGGDAGTVSYRFKPSNAARTSSSHTVYTLMRVGSVVYVSWASGF